MAELISPSAGAAASPGGGRWEPHGRLLTGCLVALNVFLVLLVYLYFWRFFSRARGSGDEEAASEADSSPPASPKARDRREVERAITALPVFVYDGTAASEAAAAECAICIAEFADGEEGRLLPRCGHSFHARCIDVWFRFHTTCPLCRASVLDAAAAAPAEKAAAQPARSQPADTVTDTDADSPV
ncbi:hypothetical protein ACP70R_028400 [Stipagrostis hirtigluma subsp. patula]